MPPTPPKPLGTLTLHLAHHGALPEHVDEAIRNNLSVLEVTGTSLWTASDETCQLERLTLDPDRRHARDHAIFDLSHHFDLPEGPTGEVDIEGVAVAGPYLWVTGSMSYARKKPKPGETDREAALDRLTQVKVDPNRWLLGRIPCLPRADGSHDLHRDIALADGTHLSAACVKFSSHGNVLTKALRTDPHLARFLEVPAKENGFDVEGIAAVHDPATGVDKVFLGLRGPVLRGWATLLELRTEPGKPGRLKLQEIGPEDEPYRKHFLDLDGLGIRDLKVIGDDLLILAGPTMDLDGPVLLWRWPGGVHCLEQDVVPRSKLELVMAIPHGTGFDHAEGIALLPAADAGAPPQLLVAYDNPGKGRLHGDGAGVNLDIFALP